MKINPIGISAYQQVSRTARTINSQNYQNVSGARLSVQPQNLTDASKISVRPRVADTNSALSISEKGALDNLLMIISEKNTSAGMSGVNRQTENPAVIGQLIDVKV